MFHLHLIKGLSYDGAVRASAGSPDVFTDDPEKYTAAMKSGYFEEIHGVPAPTEEDESPEILKGHIDPAQLETMGDEDLAKLSADMELDVAELKTKEELIKAISGVEVEAAPAEVDESLAKMTVDKLREYAKENSISLTGCGTKSEILQKINEYEADAAAASALLIGDGQ